MKIPRIYAENRLVRFVLNTLVFTPLVCILILTLLPRRKSPFSKELIPEPSSIIETPEYLFYIPPKLDLNTQHPMVMALSPGADALGMISVWKPIVEKHNWFLFASKTSRNGVDYMEVFPGLVRALRSLPKQYPILRSQVIATGYSGGGMSSHYFTYKYPDLIAAVVINTGMTPEDFTQLVRHPRHKLAVFLASPTDFRYQEMKRDRAFLQKLAWKTLWIEFPGGHILAPRQVYEEAAEWLAKEMR